VEDGSFSEKLKVKDLCKSNIRLNGA